MPTLSLMFGGSCAPIENSPPGIQIIPSGVEPEGRPLFSTVEAKVGATEAGVGVEGCAASVSWLPAHPATLKIASPTPAETIARMTIQNPRRLIRRLLDSMLLNCCCLSLIWNLNFADNPMRAPQKARQVSNSFVAYADSGGILPTSSSTVFLTEDFRAVSQAIQLASK